jgi:membrane peptidoglycan carboxypeptidase
VSTPRKKSTKSAPAKKAPARKKASTASQKPALWRRAWVRRLLWLALLLGAIATSVFAVALARTNVPTPNELATSEATIVYYADGKNEVGRLGEATRRSVTLDDIPADVQQAVLAAEDRDFYNHGGISPIGIARAAFNNVTGGNTQGGSTITQQYAKIAYLSQDRTWTRKINEALLAFKLETVVSKDQILEDYLNTIYFGRNANGIEAASIAYFGKNVNELDFTEGAVLASVIKAPSTFALDENIKELRGRWNYVLDSMVETGALSQKQRDSAAFPEILPLKQGDRLGGQVGYLLTAVEQQLLAQGFDEEEIQRGGLTVISSFDRRAQRAAQRAVKNNGPESGTEGLRIGLAAVRPGTGEVLAMYGGSDFIKDQINNATRPFAQAGSTFKPFALAAALEQGVPLQSLWNGDSPSTVNGYTFSNYGDNSYGTVSLLQATELSINSAYVELEADIGVGSVAEAALGAGIPADTPGMNLDSLDLTFVLGTASPSGLNVATAYATFADGGTRTGNTFITKVTGSNGGLLYEYEAESVPVFDADIANTVNYALQKVVTAGTAKAAQALGRPAGAKTGTTDDNKSAWFAGYTPQIAAAVLMAKENADGIPVSMSGTGGLSTVTGGSFPAAIWTAFMKDALKKEPIVEFEAPPKDATVPLKCPDFIDTDISKIPYGCPVPDVQNEFGNETTVQDPVVVPEESPTDVVPPEPTETAPANEFGPEPEAPPIDEGRPE